MQTQETRNLRSELVAKCARQLELHALSAERHEQLRLRQRNDNPTPEQAACAAVKTAEAAIQSAELRAVADEIERLARRIYAAEAVASAITGQGQSAAIPEWQERQP